MEESGERGGRAGRGYLSRSAPESLVTPLRATRNVALFDIFLPQKR